jgi:hypothetical protein
MSRSTLLALPVVALSFAFLAGCGGGSGVTRGVAPPTGAFSNSNLNGTYVFSASGTDSSGGPYAMVGNFKANGSGAISGGALDINDQLSGTLPDASITSSNYSVGADGRGQATLQISGISGLSSITLDFVLQDSAGGLVTEFDGFGSGSGTLDLASSGATPTGTYAFIMSGVYGGSTSGGGSTLSTVGNFAVGSGGAISGLEDFNLNGIVSADQTLSGTVVVGPSATPASSLTAGSFALTYDVFPVSAGHLKLIEMDTKGTLSGDAYTQSSTAMPTGTMAFTLVGGIASSIAAGGFLVTDGSGNITTASSLDVNNNGTVTNGVGFSGTYTAGGTGRFTLGNLTGFVGSSFAAYPSAGGVLLLEIDNSGLLMGAAFPQTSGTTFTAAQGYGLNLSGVNPNSSSFGTGSPVEVDDIAEFTANSSGTTVSGVIDENYAPGGGPNFALQLSGTYTPPDSTGRGTISANAGNNNNSTLNGGFGLTFYSVDGTTFPFIETDNSGQVSGGVFVEQNSSGSASAKRAHLFILQSPVRPSHR